MTILLLLLGKTGNLKLGMMGFVSDKAQEHG